VLRQPNRGFESRNITRAGVAVTGGLIFLTVGAGIGRLALIRGPRLFSASSGYGSRPRPPDKLLSIFDWVRAREVLFVRKAQSFGLDLELGFRDGVAF
jgi:hypothetical protein